MSVTLFPRVASACATSIVYRSAPPRDASACRITSPIFTLPLSTIDDRLSTSVLPLRLSRFVMFAEEARVFAQRLKREPRFAQQLHAPNDQPRQSKHPRPQRHR